MLNVGNSLEARNRPMQVEALVNVSQKPPLSHMESIPWLLFPAACKIHASAGVHATIVDELAQSKSGNMGCKICDF